MKWSWTKRRDRAHFLMISRILPLVFLSRHAEYAVNITIRTSDVFRALREPNLALVVCVIPEYVRLGFRRDSQALLLGPLPRFETVAAEQQGSEGRSCEPAKIMRSNQDMIENGKQIDLLQPCQLRPAKKTHEIKALQAKGLWHTQLGKLHNWLVETQQILLNRPSLKLSLMPDVLVFVSP